MDTTDEDNIRQEKWIDSTCHLAVDPSPDLTKPADINNIVFKVIQVIQHIGVEKLLYALPNMTRLT